MDIAETSVIFVGTVQRAGVYDEQTQRVTRAALVTVERAYVGVRDGEDELAVRAGWLDHGKQYLVVGYRNSSGEVYLGGCSPTTELSRAPRRDLRYLKRLSKREPFAALDGFVSDNGEQLGLAGVRVTARSELHDASTLTDGEGRFSFADLVPDEYAVTVEKDGYVRREQGAESVKLSHGACAYRMFDLYTDGEITGTVVRPDGSPAVRHLVGLIASRSGVLEEYVDQSVRTNEEGRYEFVGVTPGEYVIAINALSYDRDSPIVKTFYPGTPEQFRSLAVIVGPGQRHDAGWFWVPPAIAPEHLLEIEVVWPDGSPVRRGVVDGDILSEDGEEVFRIRTELDGEGRATVRAFRGLPHRFVATVFQQEWNGNRCMVCRSEEIAVSRPQASSKLRLVIEHSVLPAGPLKVE